MERFNFDISSGILFGISQGSVSLQEMINSLEYFGTHPELPRDLLILEDARLAKTEFSINELPVLGNKLKEILPLFHSIKHAVIHSDPKNTVLALIFDHKLTVTNYKLNVFSTEEGAMSWLKNQ